MREKSDLGHRRSVGRLAALLFVPYRRGRGHTHPRVTVPKNKRAPNSTPWYRPCFFFSGHMLFFRVFTAELERWPEVLEENGLKTDLGTEQIFREFTFFTMKREELETITNPAHRGRLIDREDR